MMIGYIQSVGLPVPVLALGIAIAVELLGGVALLLGYRARLVAATLAVFSIVTALTFHNNLADQMQFLNFFKNFASNCVAGFVDLTTSSSKALCGSILTESQML